MNVFTPLDNILLILPIPKTAYYVLKIHKISILTDIFSILPFSIMFSLNNGLIDITVHVDKL